jgi:metal-responsive CopG/Arc/MetJ family transcriptional regulator
MKSVTFLIDDGQLKLVDGLVGYHGFKVRSDVLRKAVKYFLENNEIARKEG